jgi:uncharacterized protein YkwD
MPILRQILRLGVVANATVVRSVWLDSAQLVARRVLTWAAPLAASLVFAATGESATLTRSEACILSAMNAVRAAHGLAALQLDPRLEGAARRHSRRMLRTGTFFHGQFVARIRGAGVRAPRIGENLAWAQRAGISLPRLSLARSIVNMWLASPAHRANLLHPGFRLVGVGAPRGSFAGRPSVSMITTDFAGY